MSDGDDIPKKQLEVSGAGTGGRKRTAIGADDGGAGKGPKEFPGSPENPSFDFIPRVVICEPHVLIRAGMKRMIPFCQVIGEASDGNEALALIRALQPELVITEIHVDGIYGTELCKLIRESFPKTSILISSHSYHATKFFHQVMRSGASGVYLKSSGRSELVKAVTDVLNGQNYCDESIARLVNQHPSPVISMPEPLTEREIEVLIRLDLRNRDIAEELGIQLNKVEKCISSILKKLGTETRTAAALMAVGLGFTLLPLMSSRNSVTGLTEEEELALAHAEAALKDGSR